ncbi:hypothetical protein B0I27_105271 [Arcticibacter pallidicorallinus]|uniref:Uncharacterized protein n=1 Tax=Arcticibacter pallidicorallinus TaxID=1259464 RepID=A0A2T0U4I6_9SPHI|nr:hypothetical protein [Arcticibacter pallidicorallinus]PRY52802.1 hypothetical protein B0I27_105271 [Arcticibacter pallidicorallinus]
MENNEEKAKAQHTTGKHPEPSDNVQSDIETVTPDTENGGLEDANKHESQDKKDQASGPDDKNSGASDNTDGKDSEQQVNDEQEDRQQGNEQQDDAGQDPEQEVSDDQSDTDQSAGDDAHGDVETVSP